MTYRLKFSLLIVRLGLLDFGQKWFILHLSLLFQWFVPMKNWRICSIEEICCVCYVWVLLKWSELLLHVKAIAELCHSNTCWTLWLRHSKTEVRNNTFSWLCPFSAPVFVFECQPRFWAELMNGKSRFSLLLFPIVNRKIWGFLNSKGFWLNDVHLWFCVKRAIIWF